MSAAVLMPASSLRGSQSVKDDLDKFAQDVGELAATLDAELKTEGIDTDAGAAGTHSSLVAPSEWGARSTTSGAGSTGVAGTGAANVGANFGIGALVAQGRGGGQDTESLGTIGGDWQALGSELYEAQRLAALLSATARALATEIQVFERDIHGATSLQQQERLLAQPSGALLELAAQPRQLQLRPEELTGFLPPAVDVAKGGYPVPFLPPPDANLPRTLSEYRGTVPRQSLQAEVQRASGSATAPAAESQSSPTGEGSAANKGGAKAVLITVLIMCPILCVLCCQ